MTSKEGLNYDGKTEEKPATMKNSISPSPVEFKNSHLEFQKFDVLTAEVGEYLIKGVCGGGTYGQVLKCLNLENKEKTALKVLRSQEGWAGKKEVANLRRLKKLDPNKNNLVRFIDHFNHKGHFCMTFELLDITLHDFLEKEGPLSLSEIRVIAQQMLVSLNALKSIGLVHADIRPNNIMLVNHKQKPFRVKLIDFRMAIHTSKIRPGYIFQKVCYRAPEVILGLPWNEAIDMWSLGCILAFLYYNQDPFPSHCQLEILKIITQMQGQFEDEMLNDAIYMRNFFTKITNSTGSSWMLKAECEFPCCTNTDTPDSSMGAFENCDSFNNIARTFPEEDSPTAQEDTQAFFSLLKRMLNADAAQRITPSRALGHRFITMRHFSKDANHYVTAARLTKKKCQHEELSVKFKRFVTSSEVIGINSVTSDPDKGCSTADRGPANKRPSGHTDLNDTVVAEETVNKKKTFIRAARRNVDKHLQLEKYDVLSGGQNRYLVQKIVGKGAFGQVAQCLRLDTKEKMAVKIVRKDESWAGKRELVMLQRLKNVDHDKYNLIKLIEHFEHNGHICLVFEMLHVSVESFIERISLKPLRLPSIRMIAQQLLMALYALKKTGVVHADIKPDNIMLVDQNLHSFKVKLIDFGMALPLSRMHTGTIIQIIGYRAPEVILGLPLGVAVDMWSLGCVLAFLYVGWDPIPLHCQYEALKVIIRVLGQPGNHLLDAATNTSCFFYKDIYPPYQWKLKRECPLRCCSNKSPRAEVYMGSFHTLKRLEELQKFHPCDVDSTYEYEDTKNFLSLLKQMLHVDPKQRITPKEALKHKFINPPLLNDTNTEPSTFTAPSTMKKCHLTGSPDKSQRLKTFTKVSSCKFTYTPGQNTLITDEENTTDDKSPNTSRLDKVTKIISKSGTPADDPATVKKTIGVTRAKLHSSVSQDSKHQTFPIQTNDIISGKVGAYLIESFRCEGKFGKLAQCTRLDTKEKMAMKIVKKGTLAGKREVRVLKKLRKLDYDKNNLVRFTEHFHHKGHICLAFEMLDMSIKDLIERKLRRKPLQLSQIRVITQQMLVALNALKDIGLAHADIKPNKIMLVNHQLNPLKVKLVDFGTTVAVSKVLPGTVVQAIGYRAPEVILGLQVDEAIDIWGLGCVLAYMYLGQDLYPLHCEREVMRVITKVQGQPSAKMLNNGIHTIDHFNHSQGRRWSFWKLKKVCGLSCCKSVKGTKTNHPMGALDRVTSFNDIVTLRSAVAEIPKDTDVFLSFLKQMLHVEPEERLTPIQALEHAFIFTKHSPADANLSSHLPSRDDKANETNNHDKAAKVSTNKKNRPKTVVKPQTITKATSTSDICQNVDGEGDNKDKGVETEGFVEVKTKRKFFNRACRFFSRMFSKLLCQRVDVIE